ncbi:glycosyltransferase family 1 protein [Cesiribacter sp. SM1]|uniref:glycosyltransferase family 4 protein n=1 Tax=Cesiribacter sp. SM1 TaxID=2861196 RepID=UPI001CD46871|nr:glycosyltransferase family 1 protein [Cesiribacter sp. SM1]
MITFFFRNNRSGAFSIEELFHTIQKELPTDCTFQSKNVPTAGTKPLNLLLNINFSRQHQTMVNHITGDIHYVALGLPANKTILTIHDLRILELGNPLRQYLLKLIWFTLPVQQVRFITVISEVIKKELLSNVQVKEHRVIVIPNCVSPAFIFIPKEFRQSSPVILHIGTKENKNLERLISAIEGIKCHLRIIGKLKLQQQELLTKHTIDYSNVCDLKFSEIVEEYQKSDLISFVSLYEGFGMPIIEAQATGRPVITSNCSSMPEVAGDGALLVDPTSVEQIRDGILRLIEDEDLRYDLIQKGLENVKRFDAKLIAEQYAALYRKIADENA